MVEPHPRGTRACRLGDQDPLIHDCFYLAPFFIILWTHLGFKRRRRRIRILPQFGTLRPRIQLPIGRRFRFPHRFQRSRPHRRRRRRRWRRRSGSRRFHDREERERKPRHFGGGCGGVGVGGLGASWIPSALATGVIW